MSLHEQLFQSSSQIGRPFQGRLLRSTELRGRLRSIEGILTRWNMSLCYDFWELSHAIRTRHSVIEGCSRRCLLLLDLIDSLLRLDSLLATVCSLGCFHGSCHLNRLLELSMLGSPLALLFLRFDSHALTTLLHFLLRDLSRGHL